MALHDLKKESVYYHVRKKTKGKQLGETIWLEQHGVYYRGEFLG